MVDTNDYVVDMVPTAPKTTYCVTQKHTGAKRYFVLPADASGIEYEYELARTIRDIEKYGGVPEVEGWG